MKVTNYGWSKALSRADTGEVCLPGCASNDTDRPQLDFHCTREAVGAAAAPAWRMSAGKFAIFGRPRPRGVQRRRAAVSVASWAAWARCSVPAGGVFWRIWAVWGVSAFVLGLQRPQRRFSWGTEPGDGRAVTTRDGGKPSAFFTCCAVPPLDRRTLPRPRFSHRVCGAVDLAAGRNDTGLAATAR